MDLVSLGCRATLIPFKGQTEQEYLATNLHNNGMFTTISLNALNLAEIRRWGLSNLEIRNQSNDLFKIGTELQDAINGLLQ